MRNIKLTTSIITGIFAMIIAAPSLAAQTGLAGCKAIVGSIQPAGTGGVVDNAGSIRATSPGPNIVICDLDSYKSFDKLFVRLEDANPNVETLCNISTYSIKGKLRASYTETPSKLFNTTSVTFLDVVDSLTILPYSYQLSCRLGQGDILHGYDVDDAVYRQ